MAEQLIRKLECFSALSDSDKSRLRDAARDVRTYGPRQDIIQEGDRPDEVHLMLDGWATRYKLLSNGDRPILAYLIPGDLCDLHVALLDEMDHSIGTLSPCRVALIPRARIEELLQDGPLARALWWSTLVDEAILREWLVTTAHRPANQRIAHFICEMLLRSKAVGLTDDDTFELPITQEELGDTMGLSTVHVNRTLQELRGKGLIESKGKLVVIDDLERLMRFADFNPNYLHGHQRGALGERVRLTRRPSERFQASDR
jgi:CRP-like cAMP-binding protein